MNRLTKDDAKEMGMVDLALNQVFVRDREAWFRDFDMEITTRDLARAMFARNGIECPSENDEFDEYMLELLQDGYETIDGMIALYYNVLWAFAEVREKLKRYEDTGLEPEELADLKDCIEGEEGTEGTAEDLLELMKYRNLEKQDRLIKLPCKVGDTVYYTSNFMGGILEEKIIEITFDKWGYRIKLYKGRILGDDEFNKKWFLTRAEAEKALEGLKK